MRNKTNRTARRAGFTLIELLATGRGRHRGGPCNHPVSRVRVGAGAGPADGLPEQPEADRGRHAAVRPRLRRDVPPAEWVGVRGLHIHQKRPGVPLPRLSCQSDQWFLGPGPVERVRPFACGLQL